MGLKEDIKLQQERLRIENDIANRVERQTKSLSAYREGVKEVKENAKQIKRLDEDILQIEKDIAKEVAKKGEADEKAIKLGKEHLANLKQRRAQVVSTNKELLNAGNLMKAMGNSMISSFKSLIPSLSDVINKAMELDDITRQTAANLGMSGTAFKTMKNATQEARQSAIEFNQPLDAAVKAVGSYAEETGRVVQLSKANFSSMMGVAQATGMATEEVAQMAGQMEAFGLGANQSSNVIMDIQSMSEQMGVNSGKVIKKFQQNLGLLNKLNFRGGMKSLAKMAAQSEKFKLSMESIAGVSEKVFRPEGAIEAAAQLQMMGGSLAQLGDPFQLMYQARNAPEELQKSIAKAAAASATFNKESGEFELSAHELDRLREASSALGLNLEEMTAAAKQTAKISMFEGMLGGMSKEDRATIAGMAQMGESGFAEVTLADGKTVKRLQDLSAEDKKLLLKKAVTDKERQDQAKSLLKEWESFQEGLIAWGVEIVEPLVESLGGGGGVLAMLKDSLNLFIAKTREYWPDVKETFTALWETFTWFGSMLAPSIKQLYKILGPGGTAIAILGGKLLFNAAKWIAQGVNLSTGFKFGMKRGGGGIGPDVKSKVKGKPGASLKSLASGLGAMGTPQVLFGALNLIPTALGMVAMVPAIPTLMIFGTIKMKALYKNLSALGRGLAMMGNPTVALGSAVLLLAAVGFTAMTAGSIGLAAIALGGVAAGAGLEALAAGLGVLGASVEISGIGILILLGLGAAMMMMGAAVYYVAEGIALIIDSFVNLFSVVSMDNIGSLLMLGPALMLASLGIISLAGSIVIMGLALANPFGLLGLIGLAAAAYSLGDAMKGVDAEGVSKAVDAVNSVNTENIEALKSLSMWLGMMGNNIKIEFGDINVDGEIDLVGGGGRKVSSELLRDTEFTNGIKRIIAKHTYADKKGGN